MRSIRLLLRAIAVIILAVAAIVLSLFAVAATLYVRRPPIVIFLFSLAAICIYLIRRLVVRTGERRLKNDTRKPILYLRSFASDVGVFDNSWWRSHFLLGRFGLVETDEQALARMLRRIGPLVAIGDPREWLPTLGAARLYRGDGDWQREVENLIERARLVIVRVGDTEGLGWELARIRALAEPTKVIIWNPSRERRKGAAAAGKSSRSSAESYWTRFRWNCRRQLRESR